MNYWLCGLLMLTSLSAAEIWVDYQKGSAQGTGARQQPLDNFYRAIRRARPGDTVKILPVSGVIRDSVVLRDKRGLIDKPIIVDGMNNVFCGSVPIKLPEWRAERAGIFSKTYKLKPDQVEKFFLIVQDQAVRMGRYSRAPGAAKFKAPDQLQPGEWTLQAQGKAQWKCYFRLPKSASTLAASQVEEPNLRLDSGVLIVSWTHSENLTVKNVIAKNFWNCGVNLHGNIKGIKLKNIAAVDCGGDGISGNGRTEVAIENFVAHGTSTGICNINHVKCHLQNVYLEKIFGREIYFTGASENYVENLAVAGNSHSGFWVLNYAGSLTLKNCYILGSGRPQHYFAYIPKKAMRSTLQKVYIAQFPRSALPSGVVRGDRAQIEQFNQKMRQKIVAQFQGKLTSLIQ